MQDKEENYFSIDFDKLNENLKQIQKDSGKSIPKDPLRGLTGELARKQLCGLAGHRSGILTKEEFDEIEKLQFEYDQCNGVLT